jgi:hypothetical protein
MIYLNNALKYYDSLYGLAKQLHDVTRKEM